MDITHDIRNKVYLKSLKYLESHDRSNMKELWNRFDIDDQVELWGMFNSAQRAAIKKLQVKGK